MSYSQHAVSYLWQTARADQSKARMSLSLLLENGAGIGDHSTGDFHKNLDESLDILADAEDRLETLGKYFPEGDA